MKRAGPTRREDRRRVIVGNGDVVCDLQKDARQLKKGGEHLPKKGDEHLLKKNIMS
jgi:hypothetical protein